MPHFLQSDAWAQFQEKLGRSVVADSGEGWSYHAFLEKGKLNSRLYAPYGPVVDFPEALVPALASMQQKAKQLGAAFLRVEPTGTVAVSDLLNTGLLRVARKQPEHTQRINLARPFPEVLTEMRKTLRNLHRNYAKKGLSVRKSSNAADVEELITLLGNVSERTGMHGHAPDYLRATAQALMPLGSASMYLVDLEGEPAPIAAALIFDDADRRYYAHAAADNAHRKLHAGSILVTQMIEDALNNGQSEFDLYGVVPPEVTDHAWSGFSDFKRSFGGNQIDYCGTWELPIKKLNYRAYSLARKVLGE